MILILAFFISVSVTAQEAGDYTVEMLERIEAFNNPKRNKCFSNNESSPTPFCGRNHGHFLNDEKNQLGFTNDGNPTQERTGLFNVGFCWWHSRMTLNAAYVAEFNRADGIEVKNKKDAAKIIKMIRKGQHVKIKNFKNLKEFSTKYKETFKHELDQWMTADSLKFKWTNAFKGPSKVTNAELTQQIESLKNDIDTNGPRFQSTQYKGILSGSHSIIITKIEKDKVKIKDIVTNKMVEQDFYKITALDSNKQHTQNIIFLPNTKQVSLSLGYYDSDEFESLSLEAYNTYIQSIYNNVQYRRIDNTKKSFVPVSFKYVDREKERLLKTYKEACK